MKKSALIFLPVAVALIAAGPRPEITINASLKDGDKISGVVTLRITATTDKGSITQTEFYVAGKLRHTDQSTPYTYEVDTILETEGAFALEVAVYTSDGENKKSTLRLTVDNDVAKGAKYHTDNGLKFMQLSKWDETIRACRIALKANETYTPAKILMSRAYMGKGVLDEAQRWGEEAQLGGESSEVFELMSGINVTKAFRIPLTGEKSDVLKAMADALKVAVTMRKKSLDYQLNKLGAVTDANRLQVVDLCIAKNDYSAARRYLREKWNDFDLPDNAIINRLIYCEMRSARFAEAYRIVGIQDKRGVADETSFALIAASHTYYRNFTSATSSLTKAIMAGGESPILLTAGAFLALRKGDRGAMQSQINEMRKKTPADAQVFYYLSLLQFQLNQIVESRDNFKNAISRDPLLYDAYIGEGIKACIRAQSASGAEKDLLLAESKQYMELALTAKEDSPEALNGLALVLLFQGKNSDAVKYAEAAARAGSEYPWAWFTYSCALDREKKTKEAQKAVETAGTFDKETLGGRSIPTLPEVWDYTLRNAKLPTLIPPR